MVSLDISFEMWAGYGLVAKKNVKYMKLPSKVGII